MKLVVEDEYCDIVGKAQKGLLLSTEDLALKAEVTETQVREARKGNFDEAVARALAGTLNLNGDALVAIGQERWYPAQPEPFDGFEFISTPFSDGYFVNSCVIWDPETSLAIVIDTGTDASPTIDLIKSKNLKLDTVYITHMHGDHVAGLDAIRKEFDCSVVVNKLESSLPDGAIGIREGYQAAHGSLKVSAIETIGHTAGGTTYIVDGLARRVAAVGDALFAGSIGGANVSYERSLETGREILKLGAETVLVPGHGPLTTVGEEMKMNCFLSV